MDINLQELKELTLKAKEEGERLFKLKEQEKTAKANRENKEAREWAEQVAKTIPDICKKAASNGESKVLIVSTIKYYHSVIWGSPYNTFKGWNTSDKNGLRFAILESIIEESGLPYSIEFQHDGVGIKSWFEIWVTWN